MSQHEKADAPPLLDKKHAVDGHFRFASERLGHRIPPGSCVLDFGCGIGDCVKLMLELGYDARGVDVREYWGADHKLYWNATEIPDESVRERLRVVDLSNYRLPYADDTFDFCFSDQVFEHVFDYETTFRELARVLKPGAISVHRFPGPNRLMEGHANLPMAGLCKNDLYLYFCTLFGGSGWRQRARDKIAIMRFVNYPSKRRLDAAARAAGVEIEFAERAEFTMRGGGRFARVLQSAARIGLDVPIVNLAGLFLQRYMVLRRVAVAHR